MRKRAEKNVFFKRLTLNKISISNLNAQELVSIRAGGGDPVGLVTISANGGELEAGGPNVCAPVYVDDTVDCLKAVVKVRTENCFLK